jgi:hypothetical protein
MAVGCPLQLRVKVMGYLLLLRKRGCQHLVMIMEVKQLVRVRVRGRMV